MIRAMSLRIETDSFTFLFLEPTEPNLTTRKASRLSVSIFARSAAVLFDISFIFMFVFLEADITCVRRLSSLLIVWFQPYEELR